MIDNAAEKSGQNDHHMLEGHLKRAINGTKGTVNMELILERTNNKPRYLFRAYSSKSRGLNSDGLFKSQAAKEGRYLNVESLTKDEMTAHLKNHISNKNCESHFISFTLSFLWVLHKALSLKEQKHQDVRIAMLDTWDIPRNTWVRHADSMLKGHGIDAKLKMENLGAAELLVWDELRVSMIELKLDDMLRAGLLTLLPFYKACDDPDNTTTDSPRTKNRKSQLRTPAAIRKLVFKHLSADAKTFVQELHKSMAPNHYRETYVAGRSFHNKKFSVWWLRQKYTPLSHEKMLRFVTFVETLFATKYQFPMLVTMLSMLLDQIDPADIIDWMPLVKDHPMMFGQNQCFKSKNRQGLEELDSFEWLLEQCANGLGIPCRTFQEWHETRFTIRPAPAAVSQLSSPTFGAGKNFKGQSMAQRNSKDESATKGFVAAKRQMQLPSPGKRKTEDESNAYSVKKRRSIRSSKLDLEAYVQRFCDGMKKLE